MADRSCQLCEPRATLSTLDRYVIHMDDDKMPRRPYPSPGSGPSSAFMRKFLKALVVDDDPVSLLLMEAILVRLGIDVMTMLDPRRALQALRVEPDRFDLLVTDYHMPEIDGAELVAAVSNELPDLPIVLVSSRLEEALNRIDRGLVDAQVAKPFGELELSAALCGVLDDRSFGCPDSGL